MSREDGGGGFEPADDARGDGDDGTGSAEPVKPAADATAVTSATPSPREDGDDGTEPAEPAADVAAVTSATPLPREDGDDGTGPVKPAADATAVTSATTPSEWSPEPTAFANRMTRRTTRRKVDFGGLHSSGVDDDDIIPVRDTVPVVRLLIEMR